MNTITPGRDQENHGRDPHWIKSSLSFSNGNCVEVAHLAGGHIGVRDSKDPEGPVLHFTPDEWSAFLGGARNGEFDGLGKELSPLTRRRAVLASAPASAISGEGPSRSGGTFALVVRDDGQFSRAPAAVARERAGCHDGSDAELRIRRRPGLIPDVDSLVSDVRAEMAALTASLAAALFSWR